MSRPRPPSCRTGHLLLPSSGVGFTFKLAKPSVSMGAVLAGALPMPATWCGPHRTRQWLRCGSTAWMMRATRSTKRFVMVLRLRFCSAWTGAQADALLAADFLQGRSWYARTSNPSDAALALPHSCRCYAGPRDAGSGLGASSMSCCASPGLGDAGWRAPSSACTATFSGPPPQPWCRCIRRRKCKRFRTCRARLPPQGTGYIAWPWPWYYGLCTCACAYSGSCRRGWTRVLPAPDRYCVLTDCGA